jgi:hypothetical protein
LLLQVKQEDSMPPRKRSRKGGKSVSTAINQQDDFRNLQGGTAGLDQLLTWLEDFDMQCNFFCVLITNEHQHF